MADRRPGPQTENRWSIRFFLCCYPRRFREEHGRDLAELYEDLARKAERGPVARAKLAVSLAVDGLRVRGDGWAQAFRRSFDQGVGMMESFWSDFRTTMRGLLKSPGFFLIAVLTVGLGVGASTAIFSVVNGVLLKPFPYGDPEDLVSINSRFLPMSGFDFPNFSVDPTEFRDYADNTRALDAVAAYYFTGLTVTGGEGDAERITAIVGTWNLLDLLHTTPALGRRLIVEDDEPNGPFISVLSHGFWDRRYGGDSDIVGKTILLNGSPSEVVAVMPEGFAFPSPNVSVWTTLNMNWAAGTNRKNHYLSVIGRLADGVALPRAQAEMSEMMDLWKSEYPDVHTGHFLRMRSLRESVSGNVSRALYTLLGAVGFVLLVVCANVANLLLVRGQSRTRENAIMQALGAGKRRVVQRVIILSGVLAVTGGAVGLGIAKLGVGGLLSVGGGNLPLQHAIGLDKTVLLFFFALIAATAALFTAIPLLQSLRPDFRTLREGARGTASPRSLRVRQVLVGGEVALSVLLVTGAVLMVRSFNNLVADDPGFRPDGVLTARVSLPGSEYPVREAVQFYDQLLDALGDLPQVVSVGAVRSIPTQGVSSMSDFQLAGLPAPPDGQPTWNAGVTSVREGYFKTMGIPLAQGRTIQATDGPDDEYVAVVSRLLADRWMPGIEPIDQQIRFATTDDEDPWFRIVGVVNDVKYNGLGQDPVPLWYLSQRQTPVLVDRGITGGFHSSMALTLRTPGDPAALVEGVRALVRNQDPDLPLIGVETLTAAVAGSVAQPRFLMLVMAGFAALALALGGVGIYGVTAYSVSQRSREIGVRMALGAQRDSVIGLILRGGLKPVLLGLLVGVVTALISGRVIESLLYDVSSTDAASFGLVVVILGGVGVAACYGPAARASRVDPVESLRAE